jgi:hypothetical protein
MGSYPSATIAVSLEAGKFYWWPNAGTSFFNAGNGTFKNVWVHIAVTRVSNVLRVFINGTQLGSNYTDNTNYNGSTTLQIGGESTTGSGNLVTIGGSLVGFTWIKGVGLYTSTFTPALRQITSSPPGGTLVLSICGNRYFGSLASTIVNNSVSCTTNLPPGYSNDTSYFNGYIDDFTVFNRTLLPGEISNLNSGSIISNAYILYGVTGTTGRTGPTGCSGAVGAYSSTGMTGPTSFGYQGATGLQGNGLVGSSGGGGLVSVVSNTSMVHYYKLSSGSYSGSQLYNYASGTAVFDATIYNSPTFQTTQSNQELQLLSASSQYIGNSNTFNIGTNGMTFACWFRSNGSGTWARIIDLGPTLGSLNHIIFVAVSSNILKNSSSCTILFTIPSIILFTNKFQIVSHMNY